MRIQAAEQEALVVGEARQLKEGRIDVGFGRLKSEDPAIRRIVLREEALMVALPAGHRLSTVEGPAKLSQVVQEPLLVYPKNPRPSFADQVLATFKERNLVPQTVLEVRELQIAIGLVGAGQGVAIVPESLQGMIRTDVVYRPLGEPSAVSPIIFSAPHEPFARAHEHAGSDLRDLRPTRDRARQACAAGSAGAAAPDRAGNR